VSTRDRMGLDERMKCYESLEAGRRLMPLVPACARIDGRNFHGFCRGLNRPYDERLSNLMARTCLHLARESGARVGYTQSDEISLVWYAEEWRSQIYFDGRAHKMVSQLAALASVYFNSLLPEVLPEKAGLLPTFDARVWSVPNLTEAVNYLLWREQDATKNSLSMAAQARFSHNQLMGKHGSEMQEMLFREHGINWNDYPAFFKRGVYVLRRTVRRPWSSEEIENLPPRHEARSNPNLEVERTLIEPVELPPLSRVTNRVEVLFQGAEPRVAV
jgi:tRNA(His) guanylyltransferase